MIAPIGPADIGAAVGAVTRSHLDDPGMCAFFPREEQRYAGIESLFGMTFRDAVGFGHVYAATVDGAIVGAAAWLPPGTFPLSLPRMLASLPAQLRLTVRAPRSLRIVSRFARITTRRADPGPYWFLGVLGVEPAFQGRGLGPALVHPVLDTVSEACLLHTSKRANLAFYGRLGFDVVDTWLVGPAGPRFWTMRRGGW